MATEAFGLRAPRRIGFDSRCLLISREMYASTGGFAAGVRGKPAASAIARSIASSGGTVRCYLGGTQLLTKSRALRTCRPSPMGRLPLALAYIYLAGGAALLALLATAASPISLGWLWVYLIYGAAAVTAEKAIGEFSWLWAVAWPLQAAYGAVNIAYLLLARPQGSRAGGGRQLAKEPNAVV